MKQRLLIFLLLIAFCQLKGQKRKIYLGTTNSIGVDFYGSIIPIFIYDASLLSNIHLGISLDESGTHGPCMSMWAYNDAYNGFRFTGLGYKLGPDLDYLILQLEAGILLEFLNWSMDSYRVELDKGGIANYFRVHFGFRFKERFAWGAQLNWIPSSKAVRFTELGRFTTRGIFEDFYRPPNRHISPSIFVGLSIK